MKKTIAFLLPVIAAAVAVAVPSARQSVGAGLPPQMQAARDSTAQPTVGTAIIAGQVLSDETTPQPVRRARVAANSLDGNVTKWTMSDAAGQFVIKDVPAGRYTIAATKAGLVRSTYGARRFDRPGTPVSVVDGQRVANLQLKMPRGAVITGMVRDETGQPAPGLRVQVQQFRTQNGERSLVQMATGDRVTDDRGAYRVFGLSPGDYVVSVMPRDAGSGDIQQTTDADLRAAQQALQPGAPPSRPPQLSPATATPGAAATPPVRNVDGPTVGFAQMFYPGTPNPADAQTVTVGPGEERGGVDVSLRLIHTARVEGMVTVPGGVSPQSVTLLMTPGVQGGQQVQLASISLNGVSPGPDGKFTFTGVAPGQYTINARASSQAGGGGAGPMATVMGDGGGRAGGPTRAGGPGLGLNLWGIAEISVDGQNISGVGITLQPGMTVSGRLAFEGTRTEPAGDVSRTTLMLTPASRGGGGRMVMFGGAAGPANGPVDASGKFTLTGITPGKYTVFAAFSSPEATWRVKSAVFKGRDILDFPLEIGPNEDIANGVVTFSDQTQTVSGKLSDASDRPAPDFTIVVFPADKALWISGRRIKTARPGTDGRYSIADLPAGEYRIAALTDIAPGDANDSAFLEQLLAASIPLSLKDGEARTQDLRIAGKIQ